jgi:tetratricopeptide (TPR) repeat protein
MPGHSEITFTQFFGSFEKSENQQLLKAEWSAAQEKMSDQIEKVAPIDLLESENLRFEKLATKEPVEILFHGSSWGAVEKRRREKSGENIPAGLLFESAKSDQTSDWNELLETGNYPSSDVTKVPTSWMVQKEWISLLKKSRQNWLSALHIGNYYFEIGEQELAIDHWKKSLEFDSSPWALRNLAIVQRDSGNFLTALDLYEEAINKFAPDLHDAFYEEYLQLLIASEKYEQLWKIYTEIISIRVPSERIDLAAAKAALQLGHFEFLAKIFTRTFAQIREGESTLVAIWFEYQAILAAQASGVPVDDQIRKLVRQNARPPKNIDFRMIES